MPISQAAGYFHWPPVWIGDKPTSQSDKALNQEVHRQDISQNITVKVLTNGVFIFDFSGTSVGFGYFPPDGDWIKQDNEVMNAIYQRIEILNAHLVCLYSALDQADKHNLGKMIVTPSNFIAYHSFDGAGAMRHENFVTAQIHYMQCPNGLPSGFGWWKEERSAVIPLRVVKQSFRQLEAILQHKSDDAIDLVNLYARSCKAYEDHDFVLSLTTSWTVIEKLLYVFWNGYLDRLNSTRHVTSKAEKFINKERRSKLNDGRDFSASTVIEALSLSGVIPLSLYKELSVLRKARNDWVHKLIPAGAEVAKDGIFRAAEMLQLVYGLNLRVSLGSQMIF